MATWRTRPDGQRSAAAKKRRRKKSGGGRGSDRHGGGGGSDEAPRVGTHAAPLEPADASRQELLTVRRALRDREQVLALTRKQLRRETKTAKARHRQLARRGSKAEKKLSRKLFAKQARGIAGAARKERERIRKRKQPEGELLHSSARKHQRLLEGYAAGSGNSGSSARGGASWR